MATDLEERIRKLEEVLARVAEGDLTTRVELSGEDDALSGLEMGINFLVVDLRSAAQANKEKEERLLAQQRELESKLATIEEQARAIRELSSPVVEVWDDVLVLPVFGVVDSARGTEMMETVLARIVALKARCLVIDVTGVASIDDATASRLVDVVRAVSLLGARSVVTGVTPAMAASLVSMGADLSAVRTLRTLKDGLRDCLAHLDRRAMPNAAMRGR